MLVYKNVTDWKYQIFKIHSTDICEMLSVGYKKMRIQMPSNSCENLKIGLRWKAGEGRIEMKTKEPIRFEDGVENILSIEKRL